MRMNCPKTAIDRSNAGAAAHYSFGLVQCKIPRDGELFV